MRQILGRRVEGRSQSVLGLGVSSRVAGELGFIQNDDLQRTMKEKFFCRDDFISNLPVGPLVIRQVAAVVG